MSDKSNLPLDDEEQRKFLDEISDLDTDDPEDALQQVFSPAETSGDGQPTVQKSEEGGQEAPEGEFDSDELKSKEGPEAPEPVAEVVAEPVLDGAPPPPEPPKALEEVAKTPEQVAAEEAAKTPAPTVEEPAPSVEEMTDIYSDWRTKTEELLAGHHYNLSPEQLEELELEPARFIPKLAAKVYLDAVSAAIGQVTTHLPRLVRIVNEQERVNNESENQFFARWPDLKAHQPTVLQIGQAWRSQNPQGSAEDFINNVGAMAMVSLKLDPTPKGQQPAVPASAPAPFVPAARTPQGGAPLKPVDSNVFTQLNRDFEEDLEF